MFWILLLVLVAGLSCWVMWAPLRLEINSINGIYKMEWWPLVSANWLPETGLDVVEVQMLFFRKQIELSKLGKKQTPPSSAPVKAPVDSPQARKRTQMSFQEIFRLVTGLVKTFRVRQCRVWWDTDDFLINAWLYPVAYLRSSGVVQVSINFQGRRDVVLVVENRLSRVIWYLTKTLIFNKFYKS